MGPRLHTMVVLSGISKGCISLGLSLQSHCLTLDLRICCRKHLNVTYALLSFCALDLHFCLLEEKANSLSRLFFFKFCHK